MNFRYTRKRKRQGKAVHWWMWVGCPLGSHQVGAGYPGRARWVARLPPGGCLEEGEALLGRDAVERRRRGHAAREALDARLLQPGNALVAVRRDDGHRVRGGHEELLAEDHVAVAVAVGRRAEVRALGSVHVVHELLGVGEVGVRVAAAGYARVGEGRVEGGKGERCRCKVVEQRGDPAPRAGGSKRSAAWLRKRAGTGQLVRPRSGAGRFCAANRTWTPLRALISHRAADAARNSRTGQCREK